ncbi:MAG: CPBP family intramembrane metalloprotease [Planctomycetes bacterium]|nr:CPBP family intramembrane metalloprotease [Planctomycetota bacterium]
MIPWPFLLPALLLPVIGTFLYFITLAGQPAAPVVYGVLKLVMVLYPLASAWLWGRPRPLAALNTRSTRRTALLTGLGAGVVMAGGLAAMAYGPLDGLRLTAAPHIAAKIAEFHCSSLPAYLAMSLALSLAHSAFEEYYWRWFVFGRLRERLPMPAAHALAGVGFALHHVVVAAVYVGWGWGLVLGAVVGLAGACWSLLYQRSGRLVGAWLAHACCDAVLMLIGWQALGGS